MPLFPLGGFCREKFLSFRFLLFPGLVLIAAFWLSACSESASGQAKRGESPKRPVVPVIVGKSIEKSVPVELRAIGKVQPYATVSVQAQVQGEITGVHFKEGQRVKEGDLLFTIDPRPFQVELKQAEANLAREKVQLQNVRRTSERYGSVVKQGYVSREQFDQLAANVASLEASILGGEAAVEKARLQLSYCTIRSPIDGYAGEVKVHKGNLVKANDNEKPLVVINQVTPVYVTFAVPEHKLADIKQHMASGPLTVSATIPGREADPSKGVLSFIDNAVDSSTGTIGLKASFPNKDGALWAGQFVNVSLTLATREGVVAIPAQAVQSGQEGHYVFVVKPDSTVEYRLVSAGLHMNGDWVIDKGLAPGETVVLDGQLRLAHGSQVRIIQSEELQAEEAAR